MEEEIPEITFDLQDGKALDLIFYDKGRRSFQFNQEALEVVMSAGGNTGLIFNIGESNNGKSFLLNRIVEVDGFERNDKGIKIWSKPFFREDENLYLFFVDVEGFEKDEKFNEFVWALAFLTGTIVLYSTTGLGEQNIASLKSLDFIKNNLIISNDETENNYMMSYYAPKLIWLAKDHFIDAEDTNGKQMLPDKFFEMVLTEDTNDDRTDSIKRFITNVMKDRTCISFEQIEPNFKNPKIDELYDYNITVLKEKIYSRSFNKYFDGVSFSSRMLVNFISGFIELYNNDQKIEYTEVLSNKFPKCYGGRV